MTITVTDLMYQIRDCASSYLGIGNLHKTSVH